MTVNLRIAAVVSALSLFLVCGGSDELAPRSPSQHTITIASFNTLRLGRGTQKDLARVAQLLASYDVVGLQEVMNEDTLKKVRDLLADSTNAPWQYVISARNIGRTSYKEYYAILYRSDRTTFVGDSVEIWNDAGDLFEREPFIASFKSGNFDYTIIVMHSDFDNNKNVMRGEARLLSGVYSAVMRRDSTERDIILMGDFNLSADDRGWDSLKAIPTMSHLIPGTMLTTLSPSGALSSAYDNLWFCKNATQHEYADTASADYYYRTMFAADANPGRTARRIVSDHVPVWARFYTNRLDDD